MRRKNLEGNFQLWKGKQLMHPAFQLAACMVVSKNGNEDWREGRIWMGVKFDKRGKLHVKHVKSLVDK